MQQYSKDDIDFTIYFKEIPNISIDGRGEDVIENEDECFIIVSDDRYTKRCISVVSMESGSVRCWQPRFDELFRVLMEYNSEMIYNMLIDISNEISSGEGEEIEDIINKNFAKYKCSLGDEDIDIELKLYLSVLREIMITEDIRFNKPYHKGRTLLIDAFYDIAIGKMNITEWRNKYNLK